jgi:type IV fimbrial biogenesis protein FimT
MTQQHGFSLTELLTATALAGLLLTQAVPAVRDLQHSSRRAVASNTLMAALSLARSEALRSRVDTVICPANAANNGCRSDGQWHSGWIAFTDHNRNNQIDGKDRIFLHESALDGVEIHSGSGRPRVRYAPNGMNRGSNLSIRVCIDGDVRSAVVLNSAGRTRLEQQASALRAMRCG